MQQTVKEKGNRYREILDDSDLHAYQVEIQDGNQYLLNMMLGACMVSEEMLDVQIFQLFSGTLEELDTEHQESNV